MCTNHQIRFIKKSGLQRIDQRIAFIGGVNPDGTTWQISQKEAIIGIESGKWIFYITCNEEFSKVIVAVSPDADKYLKAELDFLDLSLLMLLPDYPLGLQLG
ncbi:DUF3892 domain-containing protein [Flavobacterium pallidum]|uniref:DUF3892 domain-containing protein n=1 Tax=Flavobacterium pallidum TaxID=2172098 RepID=A0A2S1SJM3_9FLAO|nr:DUF3892 domain-containing protein [Flavobacterium pallidum]AWI26620.1 DUF3892 domain-containing protein [Flavobacterium pallidum]